MLDTTLPNECEAAEGAGLLRAFAERCRFSATPLIAVSPHYLIGNWAAQPLLAGIDLERVVRVVQCGSAELGRITVFERQDPGYLLDLSPPDVPGPVASCADDAFDAVLPGCSRLVRAVRRDAVRIARAAGHVLLSGERGTGKRSLGEALLSQGGRSHACIDVAAHAGALAMLRSAVYGHRPVLLLHVEALPADRLHECLDVLAHAQRGGTRVVCTVAPSLPLSLHALAGHMAWRLWLPPLRDRPEDIPEIAAAWPRRRGSARPRVDAETLRGLWSRTWPGNLRELHERLRTRGVPRAAPAQDESIRVAETGEPLGRAVERRALLQALSRCRGNRSRAAAMLGCSRATLYRKLNQFGCLEGSQT